MVQWSVVKILGRGCKGEDVACNSQKQYCMEKANTLMI